MTYKEPTSDLSLMLWRARVDAIKRGGPDADEVAPGVLRAEAAVCAWHACVVQGGFSDAEREAPRLSKDRRGQHPTEAPDGYDQLSADQSPWPTAVPAVAVTPQQFAAANTETFATLTELFQSRGITSVYRDGKPFHQVGFTDGVVVEHVGEPLQCDTCTPPAQIQGSADTRLARLHAQYPEVKAAADAAAKALKDCTDGIKLEISTLTGGALRAELAATDTAPALTLTYGESWRLDSKRLKAEDPDVYVAFAKASGSWTLKQKGSR